MATLQLTQHAALAQAFDQVDVDFKVLVPGEAEFEARQESFWTQQTGIRPACIALPRSAREVSAIVKVLVAQQAKFAVRSGGHSWLGANNIHKGVTIDLSLLNWTRFDAATETVDLGPGGRWGDVYAELDKHGRVVAGGRDGSVGVGGLILGGGISFFAGQRGFACDDVVSFEVVLGDGSIVTASATENTDLFVALKGGSNNFGIVTNYKMHALKNNSIYGGLKLYKKQYTSQAADALVHFTANAEANPDSHMLWMHTYKPEFDDAVVITALAQADGNPDTQAYDAFEGMPTIRDTCKPTTVVEAMSEYDVAPAGYQSTFHTASFANDARIVVKATELHEGFVGQLKRLIPGGDFTTQCQMQPLPKSYGKKSAQKGGNIMGVESQDKDALLFVAMVQLKTAEQQALAQPFIQAWVNDLKAFAATIDNGNFDWVYLNYANASQDPLRSYGADNVRHMKLVAAKYDPSAVFQNLCEGGFKISKVSE